MKLGLRVLLAAVVFAQVTAHAPTARADDADDEKARGDTAMDAGRAAEALEAYERAARLRWTPALDYNRGRAMLAMGDFAGALDAFESFSAKAPPDLLEKTSKLPDIVAELRTKVSELVVTCAACGAPHLTVRGKEEPFATKLRQNPGSARIVVTSAGFETATLVVELSAGASRTEAVVLSPVATTGTLRVTGAPEGALVSIDGGPKRVLQKTVELRPGTHEIELFADGYEKRHLSVVVDRGKERDVAGNLAKKPPALTSKPWFWVVVGSVVAAGATAAIVAGTRERPLDEGTLGTFRVP